MAHLGEIMQDTSVQTAAPGPDAALVATSSGRTARVPFQERRRVGAAPDLGAPPRLTGQVGELVRRCGEDVLFLHGRRASRTGHARIDLLAVTSTGVHVVAAAVPPPPPARGRRLLARQRTVLPDLTGVTESLDRQVLSVTVALGSSPMPVPVRGLVCLPADVRVRRQPAIAHQVLDLDAAVAQLTAPGRLGAEQRRAVRDALGLALPPA